MQANNLFESAASSAFAPHCSRRKTNSDHFHAEHKDKNHRRDPVVHFIQHRCTDQHISAVIKQKQRCYANEERHGKREGHIFAGDAYRTGGWSTSDEIVINYKDGSSEKIDPEKMTDIRRFDIENIKSVKYRGSEYLPERIEQAATEQ